jgi:alkyldihydroxyacetonephosphate synthase
LEHAEEVLCHFSHVYPQGTSLYMILLARTDSAAQAEQRLLAIWETAMGVCLDKGASIAHHHGTGIARLPYIRSALGSSYSLLESIKSNLDPGNILNPGKLGLTLPEDG